MAEINENDLISPGAIQVPYDLAAGFDAASAALLKLVQTGQKLGVAIKGAESISAVNVETEKLAQSQAELQKIEKQIATQQARNNAEYIKAAKALNEVKTSIREKTTLGDKDAKSVNQQNSSLKQLEAALKKNKEAYKNLANEEQRMSEEGKQLKAVIDQQSAAVKNQNESLGDFSDNVGNYEGALKGLKLELKAAKDQMAFLAKTTGTTSPEFIEASNKAGELKDQINDLNDALKNTSSSKIENLGNSLKDVGSKLLNLDFGGAAQSAKQFADISKSLTFKDITEGIKSFGNTLATVGKALLTNPIFLIAAAVAAIALALKYFYDQQEKNSQRQIERYQKELDAVTTRYDKEIKLQQIVGKQTFELERAKQKLIAQTAEKQIKALGRVTEVDLVQSLISRSLIMKVNDEKLKQLDDFTKKKQQANDELEIIDAEQAEFERKTSADLAKQKASDLFELNKFRIQIAIDGQKEIIDNEKKSYNERALAIAQFNKLKDQLARLERDNALREANLTADALLLIDEQYRNSLAKNNKESKDQIKKLDSDFLDRFQDKLKKASDKTAQQFGSVRQKIEDDYNKPIKGGLLKSIQDGIQHVSDTASFKLGEWKEKAENTLKDIQAIFNTFGLSLANLYNSISDRRISNLQNEQKALEEAHNREIELAGDNARAKEQIDARYEAKRTQLDKKILQEKQKQARLDKALAIVQIAIDTAKNIVKVFPNPALIAAAIALGAIQTAAVVTKPIPQFFKGTKSAPGGAAIVGERGAELMRKPGGQLELTPSVATVMNVPRGTEIVPHGETMRMLAMGALSSNGGSQERHDYGPEMIEELRQFNSNLSRLKPVKQSLVRSGAVVYHAIKSSEGHTKLVRSINLGKWL